MTRHTQNRLYRIGVWLGRGRGESTVIAAAWVRVSGFGSMAMLTAFLMRRCIRISYRAAS